MQALQEKLPVDLSQVIGVVMVGSSSREYKDPLSDLDIEVIVRNEVYRSLQRKTQTFLPEHKGAELLFFPYTEFQLKKVSPLDLDHWPYVHARIIYDQSGVIEQEIKQIVSMPYDLALARSKLHYFEFLFSVNRLEKLIVRGSRLNLNLTIHQALASFIRLMFVTQQQWPPLLHWATQNLLEIEGVPGQMIALATALSEKPSVTCRDQLLLAIDKYLLDGGYTFHFSKTELMNEVCSDSFRNIREAYCNL